jgi:hypothetical protein
MTITRNNPTELRLIGMGVHPYSARGLTQSLTPIDEAANLERSCNGELLDLGYEPMRKYKSTISGADQRPPAFDQMWPGMTLIVECIAELVVEGGPPFGRDPVDYIGINTEAGFSAYRPRLVMKVISWDMEEEEWEAGVNWSLELEEV